MVWIPGGEFSMGLATGGEMTAAPDKMMSDARPVHRVAIDGLWMDRTEVTNAQFARFVAATGYVTVAEQAPTPAEKAAAGGTLAAGSLVFTPAAGPVALDDFRQWWRYEPGANWRHPEGPGSDLTGRERYPVVQVAYADAAAYAQWADKELPTEAEWEFAARGGLAGKRYEWGDDFRPHDAWMANTFQGHFPGKDLAQDGFAGLAPVASFPANGYGLYDMAGNAWEWCSDRYRSDYYARLAARGRVARNPSGPAAPAGSDPTEEEEHVQRGGSFLCTDQYCSGYLVGMRGKGDARSSGNHIGFRCVRKLAKR